MDPSQRVRAQARQQGGLRCALCHGDVEETHSPCPGCRTMVHPECRQQNGGCPTLGCSYQTQRPVRRRNAARNRRRQPTDWLAVLRAMCGVGSVVLVVLGVIGMLVGMGFMSMHSSKDIMAGAAGFIGGALMLASGVLSLALIATRWQDPSQM